MRKNPTGSDVAKRLAGALVGAMGGAVISIVQQVPAVTVKEADGSTLDITIPEKELVEYENRKLLYAGIGAVVGFVVAPNVFQD